MSKTLTIFKPSTITKKLLVLAAAALIAFGANDVRKNGRKYCTEASAEIKHRYATISISYAISNKNYSKALSLLDENKKQLSQEEFSRLEEAAKKILPHGRFKDIMSRTNVNNEWRFNELEDIACQFGALKEQDKEFNAAFVKVSADYIKERYDGQNYDSNGTKKAVEKFIKAYAPIADSESLAVLKKDIEERLFESVLQSEIRRLEDYPGKWTAGFAGILPYIGSSTALLDIDDEMKDAMRKKTFDIVGSRISATIGSTSSSDEQRLNSIITLALLEKKYGWKSNIDNSSLLKHAGGNFGEFMDYSLPTIESRTTNDVSKKEVQVGTSLHDGM